MAQQMSMFDWPELTHPDRYHVMAYSRDSGYDGKREFKTIREARRAILTRYADYDGWYIWDYWTRTIAEAYGDFPYGAAVNGQPLENVAQRVWDVPWMVRNKAFIARHPEPLPVTWTSKVKTAGAV